MLEIGSVVCLKIEDRYLAATAAHNVRHLDPPRIEIVPAGERNAEALRVCRIGYPTNTEDEDVACVELDPQQCARAQRVRFVHLNQIAPLTEQSEPQVCFLQGYPARNLEKPAHAQHRPLAESDGLLTLVIPLPMRPAAQDPRVIGIEYPPHDDSLKKAGLPHPAGLSGGAVWLFPTFRENLVWSPDKARLVAIERGWWREEKEVIATRIEVWLRLVATQNPEASLHNRGQVRPTRVEGPFHRD